MTTSEDSKVLILILPDLFSAGELQNMLEERCSQIGNLGSLSKERLVGLFRRIIVPFPQRIYRSNRRGKMLTARRVKSGLEGRRAIDTEEEGSPFKRHCNKFSNSDRLKPPPSSGTPSKIRIDGGGGGAKSESRSDKFDGRYQGSEDKSIRKVELKRQTEVHTSSDSENKRRRTAIQWP